MAFISVPLRNVGRSMAIVDEDAITITGTMLGEPKGQPFVRRVRVPTAETTRVNLIVQATRDVMEPSERWLLKVPYTDFARRQGTVAVISLGYRGDSPADGEWLVMGVDHRESE
ncbi:MAG TPA: hypothetical protein VEF89_18620 [Solirubrobacteraceae bacterium]|nr:hypothetical protein [Solirubrobacteraceae bacterium]